jgi:DNA-binding NarL/FixJ family response regulator
MSDREPTSGTVVVADDSVLLRDGLVRLLEDGGFEVIDAVGDAEALLTSIERRSPDLAIVDVRMPPTHTDEGIRAALRIRSEHPAVAVLVLSQYVEQRYAAELLAGDTEGVGYLLKDRVVDVDDFLAAAQRVMRGGNAIDAEVVSQILGRSARRSDVEELTPREQEVLSAMAEGLSNAGIAEKLVISGGAVEKHVGNVLAKLGLDDGTHANRRVLAVLRYLESTDHPAAGD